MYPAEIFRDTLSRLLVFLTNHKVRFHLTGGITSVAYGEPRMTQDIEPHGHDVRLPAGGGRGRQGVALSVPLAGATRHPRLPRRRRRSGHL